jgi:predicted CXXCH cytochrome family protein
MPRGCAVKRLFVFTAAYAVIVAATIAAVLWLRTTSKHFHLPSAAEAPTGKIPGALLGKGHAAHLGSAAGVVCESCHTFDADTFTKPTVDRCEGCHTDRKLGLHQSGAASAAGAADCSTCHSFVTRPGDDKDPWTCMRCHAEQQGSLGPIAVHAKEDCGTCHHPHDAKATRPADCRSCHDGRRAPMHVLRDPSMACESCHKPHEKAPRGGDKCTGCHFDKPPVIAQTAVFAGGHECTSCHSSHENGASVQTACSACHSTKHVVGMDHIPEHADCRSCHDQHNVMGNPQNACLKCHATEHKNQAIDVSAGCTACHDVHGSGNATLTPMGGGTNCTGCHEIASNNHAFHDGRAECSDCHATHGSNPLGPMEIKGCTQCHDREAELVSLNVGHGQCRNCHVPHAPLPTKTACGGCHETQSQTAPRGHTSCQSCHDPHSGARPVCTTCHANKKASIHGNIEGGCQTCHRPHGPEGPASPPACTTCHRQNTLQALHAIPQHGTCQSCHQAPHSPPAADRATCIACHTDRKDHVKEATRCTGCHNFRGGQ